MRKALDGKLVPLNEVMARQDQALAAAEETLGKAGMRNCAAVARISKYGNQPLGEDGRSDDPYAPHSYLGCTRL